MHDEIASEIERQSLEPLTSGTDGQTATGRSVGDMIQGAQFAAGVKAARRGRRGIRFSKLINPGALSDGGRFHGSFDRPGRL